MDCGTSLVKYILFLFNILCSICGILLIVFGVLLFSNVHSVSDLEDAVHTQQIPIALIVLGAIILVISFFGCCGAIRESYCMSMTYGFFLLVLLILQVVLISTVWMNKEQILDGVGKVVDKAWEERSRGKATAMDAIQTGFKCCGKNSVIDYGLNIPSSCCKEQNCLNPLNIYPLGCKYAFRDFWDKNSDIIKFAGLGIAVIELVGFIFACCLANNIRNFRRRADY